jgi:hypothetical protein
MFERVLGIFICHWAIDCLKQIDASLEFFKLILPFPNVKKILEDCGKHRVIMQGIPWPHHLEAPCTAIRLRGPSAGGERGRGGPKISPTNPIPCLVPWWC